jgi:heavy metal translocating P-type ATPase
VRIIKSYPWVIATLTVLVATLVLEWSGASEIGRWIATLFGAAVIVRVSIGMVKDLINGHWGIDVLALMAILSTLLVGEYIAALIVCLMLTGGEALEDYAANRAKRSLSALLERAGSTRDIPLADVAVGDRLLVRPAEVVPVDGMLTADDGDADVQADFDQSSLTGESLPVTKRIGDEVMSGALNGQRAVMIQATAEARDSQYARILDLVREASDSRAPMVRLADRYAVPFTVIALVIAGLAWWISGDPVRFAEVLVVATPCPLLIAAPVAFLGGMSRAAKAGVIVKSGGTLEKLAEVKTAAFDKTGTLTYGRPELLRVDAVLPQMNGDELLQLVASAEQYSAHVLADSIKQEAVRRGLALISAAEATEEATNGVVAHLSGKVVIVGKRDFVALHSHGLTEATLAPGESAVYVGIDGAFAGTVILSDRLRENAPATLQALSGWGVRRQLMLTGDAAATAAHIASRAGLTEVHADLLPADKVRLLMQAEPKPVLMVGDGVNDAPVLASADVGIAMGARGATAASETADVVILKDDISQVVTAVAVGHRTMRVAKESIWAGIALSIVLMIVAAGGVIPAIIGALLQEVVDVVSIANSLRAMKPGRERKQRALSPARDV